MTFAQKVGSLAFTVALFLLSACSDPATEDSNPVTKTANVADVIFIGGDVYTVETDRPWAKVSPLRATKSSQFSMMLLRLILILVTIRASLILRAAC